VTRTRCVLAYSGGLDTSVAIHWLGERGYDVVTLTADLGEAKDADAVAERAIQTGALAAHVVDARRAFVEDFCFPTLAAGALPKRDLITYRRGSVRIKDRPALERAACERYEIVRREATRLMETARPA
jgi:argininosuccinate synthase